MATSYKILGQVATATAGATTEAVQRHLQCTVARANAKWAMAR